MGLVNEKLMRVYHYDKTNFDHDNVNISYKKTKKVYFKYGRKLEDIHIKKYRKIIFSKKIIVKSKIISTVTDRFNYASCSDETKGGKIFRVLLQLKMEYKEI